MNSPKDDSSTDSVIEDNGLLCNSNLIDAAGLSISNQSLAGSTDLECLGTTTETRNSINSLESLTIGDGKHHSTESFESLDLDIPSSYHVEPVDFPKSPGELKRTGKHLLPVEPGGSPSDDEEDQSIFQAQLSSNCQDVRLTKDCDKAARLGNRRKLISVSSDVLHSTEDDVKAERGSSCDGSYLDPDDPDLDDLAEDDLESNFYSDRKDQERIPELTAAQEAAEMRAWRSFFVAGTEQRIDLRVLEPYKRVVSHGGYLSQGSRNAIIVFSACFLPDRSRVDYDYVMSNLFMYVIATLDQLVTDEYILIYLHGATSRSHMPKFSWIKQCYQMIDRKLRKNLKGLYLVHPTFWLKTLVIMTRPFISSKFSKKLFFIYSLNELYRKIPIERASVPECVVRYDFNAFGDISVFET